MMKMEMKSSRFYMSVLTALCFFVGIAAGTVWVNMMSKEVQEELSVFGQAWLAAEQGKVVPRPDRILPVLIKREMGAGFLWLVGMSLFSAPGLLAVAAFGGFSMASVISLTTVQAGLFGLPVYLLSILPQMIFYLPVIGILFFWGMEPYKKPHVAGFIVLMLMIAAGSVAETCLNPYFFNALNWFKS